jgi:hypothetical protein
MSEHEQGPQHLAVTAGPRPMSPGQGARPALINQIRNCGIRREDGVFEPAPQRAAEPGVYRDLEALLWAVEQPPG